MSAKVVNGILEQINAQSNSNQIKKLLFLKLEQELNSSRAIIDGELIKQHKEDMEKQDD